MNKKFVSDFSNDLKEIGDEVKSRNNEQK